MYPSLTCSDFYLLCFLKSLSLSSKFAAAVACLAHRLCAPNDLVSSPIFSSPCNTFSMEHVQLICLSQVLSFAWDFLVIIPLRISGNCL